MDGALTWGEVAGGELAALAGALGLGGDAAAWQAQLAAVTAPCAWRARDADGPRLPSGLSHRRPIAFSVVLGAGAPELRCFFEAQAEPASAAGYWAAGEGVTAAMVSGGADGARLAAIAELFVPTDEGAPFRVWHGGVFRRGAPMLGKVYLCPAAQGQAGARERVGEALRRLGCEAALAALGSIDGEVAIVSLDLEASAAARVKLYAVLRDAGPARVQAAYRGPAEDVDALAGAFFDAAREAPAGAFVARQREAPAGAFVAREREELAGASIAGGRAAARRWMVSHAWSEGWVRGVLHLSLHRHAAGDADATARVAALATRLGVDAAPLRACREALGSPAGELHVVTLQRGPGGAPRLTVYFAPREAR